MGNYCGLKKFTEQDTVYLKFGQQTILRKSEIICIWPETMMSYAQFGRIECYQQTWMQSIPCRPQLIASAIIYNQSQSFEASEVQSGFTKEVAL